MGTFGPDMVGTVVLTTNLPPLFTLERNPSRHPLNHRSRLEYPTPFSRACRPTTMYPSNPLLLRTYNPCTGCQEIGWCLRSILRNCQSQWTRAPCPSFMPDMHFIPKDQKGSHRHIGLDKTWSLDNTERRSLLLPETIHECNSVSTPPVLPDHCLLYIIDSITTQRPRAMLHRRHLVIRRTTLASRLGRQRPDWRETSAVTHALLRLILAELSGPSVDIKPI